MSRKRVKTAEEKKAYARAYYLANKDKWVASSLARRGNPRKSALSREFRLANYQRRRAHFMAKSRAYYWANREQVKFRNGLAVKEHKLMLRAFADAEMAKGCVDCGIKTQTVLDFDHIRGSKFKPISHMIRANYPLVRVLAEIDKCEVRCANCHRIITHERRRNRVA